MIFQNYKMDGDSITFTKKELKIAEECFRKKADKFRPKMNQEWDARYAVNLGKAALLRDILKLFEL